MITQPVEDIKLPQDLQKHIDKVKVGLATQEQEVLTLKQSKIGLTAEIRQLIVDKKAHEDEIEELNYSKKEDLKSQQINREILKTQKEEIRNNKEENEKIKSETEKILTDIENKRQEALTREQAANMRIMQTEAGEKDFTEAKKTFNEKVEKLNSFLSEIN